MESAETSDPIDRLRRDCLSRLRSVLGRVPVSELAELADSPPLGGWLTGDRPPPNWVVIPGSLRDAWTVEGKGRLTDEELTEIVWGQFALFAFVRIQDDLLDGQYEDLRLQFVADHLLLESISAFAGLPKLDERFREAYGNCLKATTRGVLAVGDLESRPGTFTSRHLDLHADVSAIFHVGSAAVCHMMRKSDALTWIGAFLDQMAVAGQILDDLVDLFEDVGVNRFTWVANVMSDAEPGETSTPDRWMKGLRTGVLRPHRLQPVWSELQRRARLGAESLPEEAPEVLHSMAASLEERMAHLASRVHEMRVGWALGGLPG